MALKYQCNKIALQNLNKHMNTRLMAISTLKNNETAIPMEVLRAKDKVKESESVIAGVVSGTIFSVKQWWLQYSPNCMQLLPLRQHF